MQKKFLVALLAGAMIQTLAAGTALAQANFY